MAYTRAVRKKLTLPSGVDVVIRKINPLRLSEIPEGEDTPIRTEKSMNMIIMAGVVEPKLRLEGLDILLPDEEEPLTYEDKVFLSGAINVWSGLTLQAMEARRKFRDEQLGLDYLSNIEANRLSEATPRTGEDTSGRPPTGPGGTRRRQKKRGK